MALAGHYVVFTFKNYSHYLPTIHLCANLCSTNNIHCTIIVDETAWDCIKTNNLIPDQLGNAIPGIELYPFQISENTNEAYISQLVGIAPQAIKNISKRKRVTGFVFETFGTHAFEQTIPFHLPHYVFFSINGLATMHRILPDIYPKLCENPPLLPDKITPPVCKQAINDIALMHWLHQRFRYSEKKRKSKKVDMMEDHSQLVRAVKTSRAVWINSFDGFETKSSLDLIRNHHQINAEICFVGPVGLHLNTVLAHPILDWLNGKPTNSVLYIAHGCYLKIKDEEVVEMEMALKKLGIPFIWSLPDNQQALLIDNSSCNEFAGSQQGIITSWAPQVSILHHNSTCAFLSHVGWNSTLEAINAGVPIIAWPLHTEQFINAAMIDAKGIGIFVEGTSRAHDTILKCDDIVDCILQVYENETCRESIRFYQAELKKAKLHFKTY
ncbi:hypothetical protein HDV01_001352 [Terramyces sp. JEL0728]|nr:hypothetical protein HDV01_001352 [Terramyces sp. JEL0728]